MENFEQAIESIRQSDAKSQEATLNRQLTLTKPANSLGVLEELSIQLAGIKSSCPPPLILNPALAVFASDHGVVDEKVTPWPSEITRQMVANFLEGGAAVSVIANALNIKMVVVDVGVAGDELNLEGLINKRVAPGTKNILKEDAMTTLEAKACLNAGFEVAQELVESGADLLVTGDMGIGNTTPSAAIISAFTGLVPREVTGRGTGIDDEFWHRKVSVIQEAHLRSGIAQPGSMPSVEKMDPVLVLAAVGGFEIGAIAGFILGAASRGMPVVIDGVIAAAGALVANALAPYSRDYMIAGHLSVEPGAKAALEYLEKRPLLNLDMRLGEGTGACLAVPIVQVAAKIINEMATFDEANVTEKE